MTTEHTSGERNMRDVMARAVVLHNRKLDALAVKRAAASMHRDWRVRQCAEVGVEIEADRLRQQAKIINARIDRHAMGVETRARMP